MRWFTAYAVSDWLTCPTTQNGAIRIMSGSRYGPTSFTPAAAIDRLESLVHETDHRFVADNASLMDASKIDRSQLTTSGQVTDTYLLALAVAHEAHLATMDHRLRSEAAIGGIDYLHRIP